MDLVSLLLYSLCIVMICAPGPAQGSTGDQTRCPCPDIPTRPLTEPPNGTCLTKFRYVCIHGYVRKAGTSNLIKCNGADGDSQGTWSTPSLECIPDPRITTTPQTPGQAETTASTSQQMTQSMIPSTTEAAETNSTEPTSLVTDHSQAYFVTQTAGVKTTPIPTTTRSSDNSTADPLVWNEQSHGTAAGVTCAALAIVCGVIGISFWCYRRKKSNIPPPTREEQTPMNPVPPEQEI
ncbi:interleukin-15 receptor subunit alpha isoform X1 [Notolabrus celidotus]|uniref:interleukin-15 receptor subunit alpha isoform X1 n=1 Tax=Notolabrus celidotus TaxID=1203425 RepID=UPI001490445A|nr:interleukin-15 receptor subunit alpha isoform X1 [Notolabrus celidotus]